MPSNFYAVSDPSTPTGLRVNFTDDMLPKDRNGRVTNSSVLRFGMRDGFSTGGPLVALLSTTPAFTSQTPTWKNISLSLDAANSPTLMIDCSTKKLIPHWIEVDERSYPFEGAHPPLMIYPAAVLPNNRRIIVALRGMNSAADGSFIQPSAEFRALRDGLPSKCSSINDRRQVYAAIFDSIADVTKTADRSQLQLVWEFTTQSEASQTREVMHMANDALKRMPPDGPKYHFYDIQRNPRSDVYAYVFGEMEVPIYIDSIQPGARLVLDPKSHLPVFQRLANVTFMLSVPNSLMRAKNGSFAGSLLQVGHGLFSNITEIQGSPYPEVSERGKYLVGTVQWWGLCRTDDIELALIAIFDMSLFVTVPDSLSQSLVNHLYLTKLYLHKLGKDPLFAGRLSSEVRYNGNSLGAIMGSVLMTISKDFKKGVLGVGGAPFGLLLPRAQDFIPFFAAFVVRGFDVVERIVNVYLLSFLVDRVMPSGYIRHLTADPLPDTPLKHVVFQCGLSDAQVTPIADEVYARAANASIFPGTVHEEGEKLFGFPFAESPVKFVEGKGGAVLQIWNFSNPPMPFADSPQWPWYTTHSCTRNDPRAIAQMLHFFETDEVVDFCGVGGCQRLNSTKCH